MLLGTLLALLAACLYAGGNILQKRAVDRLGALSLRNLIHTVSELGSSLPWLAGAGVSVLGILIQVLAFQRVPISVVQSVGVVGTMLLIVASRMHFHESFSKRETLGLIISIAALLMTSLSLIGGESSAGQQAEYATFIVATAGTATLACTILVFASRISMSADSMYAISSGMFYGLVGLSAKGLSTLVAHGSLSTDVGNVFRSPYPYVFVGAWALAIATFQLGIQRGRVGAIGPLSGATSAVYVVAVGTPVFGESLPHTVGTAVLRIAGFVSVVIGSLLFAWSDKSEVHIEPVNDAHTLPKDSAATTE